MQETHPPFLRISHWLEVSVVLCACVLCSACGYLSRPHQGQDLNERWESTNGAFSIRVSAYAEEGGFFIAGAYYLFESAPANSGQWQPIVTIRLDDPDPIPRDQVRFVSDHAAYFFLKYHYGVTTDGGRTWFVWNAVERLPDWSTHRAYILGVDMGPHGQGRMSLKSIESSQEVILRTDNYGVNWSPDRPADGLPEEYE